MGKPYEKPFATWEEFASFNFGHFSHAPGVNVLLLRGEARLYERPMLPTLLQHAGDLSATQVLKIERLAVEQFQRSAALTHVSTGALPSRDDHLGWWTLMQHHGAPTRLLDWTTSPFVAAYIAVSSELQKDGIIWGINHLTVQELQGSPVSPLSVYDPFAPDRLLFQLPTHFQTEREKVQQTALTYSPQIMSDPLPAISRLFMDADHRFVKFIIPKEKKLTFLRGLEVMNITGAALFPGPDGLGRAIRDMVTLDAHFTRNRMSRPL